jgi:hypothetical protein
VMNCCVAPEREALYRIKGRFVNAKAKVLQTVW